MTSSSETTEKTDTASPTKAAGPFATPGKPSTVTPEAAKKSEKIRDGARAQLPKKRGRPSKADLLRRAEQEQQARQAEEDSGPSPAYVKKCRATLAMVNPPARAVAKQLALEPEQLEASKEELDMGSALVANATSDMDPSTVKKLGTWGLVLFGAVFVIPRAVLVVTRIMELRAINEANAKAQAEEAARAGSIPATARVVK